MKKPYSKPQITFESFELSQSIAYGCTFISNHEYESCSIEIFPGWEIFSVGSCTETPTEGAGDRLCYDVPAPDSRVFSS